MGFYETVVHSMCLVDSIQTIDGHIFPGSLLHVGFLLRLVHIIFRIGTL